MTKPHFKGSTSRNNHVQVRLSAYEHRGQGQMQEVCHITMLDYLFKDRKSLEESYYFPLPIKESKEQIVPLVIPQGYGFTAHVRIRCKQTCTNQQTDSRCLSPLITTTVMPVRVPSDPERQSPPSECCLYQALQQSVQGDYEENKIRQSSTLTCKVKDTEALCLISASTL